MLKLFNLLAAGSLVCFCSCRDTGLKFAPEPTPSARPAVSIQEPAVVTSDGWRVAGSNSWIRGRFQDLDDNGDGKVDMRIESLGGTDNYLVKRDKDFDGFFDVEWQPGFYCSISLACICIRNQCYFLPGIIFISY